VTHPPPAFLSILFITQMIQVHIELLFNELEDLRLENIIEHTVDIDRTISLEGIPCISLVGSRGGASGSPIELTLRRKLSSSAAPSLPLVTAVRLERRSWVAGSSPSPMSLQVGSRGGAASSSPIEPTLGSGHSSSSTPSLLSFIAVRLERRGWVARSNPSPMSPLVGS
jgi:hypothetical protein